MQMTIARAMTRRKTIKAQLDKITEDISKHGAINNKRLHILSDEKNDIKKNHREATEKIKSLFQQFDDLKVNYIKLTLAINKANLETDIIIAEQTMKIAEALVYKSEIQLYLMNLKLAYQKVLTLPPMNEWGSKVHQISSLLSHQPLLLVGYNIKTLTDFL